ncbi:L domain-like protein [Calocera viscosa TUFC12733]|uniref:L domain-like protein n=1 Tax=Calocera viscosa (strain TUFC12733) TaxID=1330018 RepID=A0A167QZ89_CALVF|nr:L domain-like protein [Calocera viscosa TUFC12733]
MGKLSLKEQIAQRRAMVRDQATKATVTKPLDAEWADGRGFSGKKEEVDILGRSSMLVDITRARTSGKLDLSFRSLPCLPYALFNLHLGMEPSFPTPPPRDPTEKEVKQPSFYECIDLVSLRARDNMIEEIQEEISYFVSLKVLDLNRNKLSKLPPSFSELQSLINLDLAHNQFTSVPAELASLTALASLDISNNPLTGLENIPASLSVLLVSHCQLTLASLAGLPSGLIQLDISNNALGASPLLSGILERLSQLKSLTAKSCDLDPDDFQGDGWWMTRLSTLELGGPQKEAWEIEAEQRVTRRRHPAATSSPKQDRSANDDSGKSPSEDANAAEISAAGQGGGSESHVLDVFFNASTLTLTLPSSRARPTPPAYIPANTLPYDVILRHGWTDDLKCLVVTGRNTNPLFTLPGDDGGMVVLDRVEQLTMIDCGLAESTRIQVAGVERHEGTFALIARLFPSVRSLDLSYNRLPTLAGIREVLLLRRDNADGKTGVCELKLKGCGVNNLDELVALLEEAGPEPAGSGLALRELDLSDNEIAKVRLFDLIGNRPRLKQNLLSRTFAFISSHSS